MPAKVAQKKPASRTIVQRKPATRIRIRDRAGERSRDRIAHTARVDEMVAAAYIRGEAAGKLSRPSHNRDVDKQFACSQSDHDSIMTEGFTAGKLQTTETIGHEYVVAMAMLMLKCDGETKAELVHRMKGSEILRTLCHNIHKNIGNMRFTCEDMDVDWPRAEFDDTSDATGKWPMQAAIRGFLNID